MVLIDLAEKVQTRTPDPEQGRYAFRQAVLPTLIGFVAIVGLAYLLIALASWLGWEKVPVSTAYAATVLIVAGLLISSLISSASQRFDQDHAAAGVLSTAFSLLAHGIQNAPTEASDGAEKTLQTLEHFAWSTYYFLDGQAVMVKFGGKELMGRQPILAQLISLVDALQLNTELKLELLTQLREMQSALGGIARRRDYPILRSRYVVNVGFSALGVLLLCLSSISGDGILWLGLLVSFMFTYGLTTVIFYVKHMAYGIGYDPGDVRPDMCLTNWRREIIAARTNCHNLEG